MSMLKSRRILAIVSTPLWVLAIPLVVLATQVTLPFTFVPGTTADANQVNANFVALRDGINGLHTTGGVILAAAHVEGGIPPVVTRSFSNLPGAAVPTVNRVNVGVYTIDFGANVANRFFSVVQGNATDGLPAGGSCDVTPQSGNLNALFIRLFDNAGAPVDTNFFVHVH